MATGTSFNLPAHGAAFSDADERWGPLQKLAGQWASDKGRDFSYSYSKEKDIENLYREAITFDPFGPVDNGKQSLFGLDYRMKAWRLGADDFFHMEVGYWLFDADAGLIHRCFMVPRTTGVTRSEKRSCPGRLSMTSHNCHRVKATRTDPIAAMPIPGSQLPLKSPRL